MLDTVIVTITCIFNLLLGLVVFLRNPKPAYSKAFFGISLSVSAWILCNYFTEYGFTSVAWNTFFNTGAYPCAFLAIFSATWFTFYFPVHLRISSLEKNLINGLGFIIVALSLTPLVAGHVTFETSQLQFSVGELLPAYIAGVIILMLVVTRNLLHSVRGQHGNVKQQALLILFGFIFAAGMALITNAILPAITETWHTTRLGPAFTMVLVGVIATAIIRHRLFDIKLVIVRSLGYVLTLILFASIYGFVVFGLADLIFDLHFPGVVQAILSGATGLAALSFHYFKSSFDRMTNRLFFKDAYNPQVFFDEFNKMLATTIDLEKVLNRASQIIAGHLKAQLCVIEIEDSNGHMYRNTGKMDRTLPESEAAIIRKAVTRLRGRVVVADELSSEHVQLRNTLNRNGVAMVARINSNTKASSESLGYIILGVKKSGDPYASTDIKVIETVANELTVAIQNALRFEEIEKFNATLQQKVAEATRHLKETNAKLKALDETKDDFISMASHQLRTPLTSVKGYLSLVLEGDAGKITDTQHKLLGQAFISSQRMVFLIADLLNVSRLKTGKFIIEPALINLADIVAGEIDQLVETAESRGLNLVYRKPEQFPAVSLDETKTRQVIMNFIDNAIYYTPEGGKITVELLDRGKSIELRVSDTGIGVPKSEQYHLFSKFYRAKNAQRARPDGTGLGLFMAKKVIVAQGGAIIFQSTEGKGSVFGFTFPKA